MNSIYNRLFDWQKKLVDNYKNRESFGLFLDCGLGKTPISLGFAEQNNCTKIIIITINAKAIEDENVDGSWFNWAKKSSIEYNLHFKKDTSFDQKNNDILLINYESLYNRSNKKLNEKAKLKDNVVTFIKSCKNHNVAIIVDESHKLKDIKSIQTLCVKKIQKNLRLFSNNVYTYLLTGTPFTTGFIDLYSQLCFLGYDETKSHFIDNFCIRGNLPGLLGWQQPIVGYKNIKELYDLVHKYAITIKSDEVAKNLPEKIFIEHSYPATNHIKMITYEKYYGEKIYDYIKERQLKLPEYDNLKNIKKRVNNIFYRNIDFPNDKYLAETSGAFWLRTRQLSIGFQGNAEKCIWYDRTRLNMLQHFLENNKNNYLLFYNYTPELLEIYEICDKLGYNIDVYCGEIKSLHFYNRWCNLTDEQKLSTEKKNIILANFSSGSTGMNWQQYSQCIIFSTPLYKDYEQGIKRIHRTGQKETTIYHEFFQENWLDKGMRKSLKECVDYSNEMFKADLLRAQELMEEEDEKN